MKFEMTQGYFIPESGILSHPRHIWQCQGSCLMNNFKEKAPAARDNAIIAGNARFTVITGRLMRLEWSEDGVFDDRPTQNICCRDLGSQHFSVSRDEKSLRIDTGRMQLEYRPDGGLTADSLQIAFDLNGARVCWHPGLADDRNLKGSFTELDMLDGDDLLDLMPWVEGKRQIRGKFHPGDGLLSRSGWSVFDDSMTAAIVPHPVFGEWIDVRPKAARRRDLYFFGYGHDYRSCLLAASQLFGRPPLPPHYVFGHWYSRYWAYDDVQLEELSARFEQAGAPLDVLGIDMDWHLPGWTGYTWDPAFFPDPRRFLGKIHELGIHPALNLHPDQGVGPQEKCYADFAAAMKAEGDGRKIPFALDDPHFMDLYFKLLLNPEEDRGVDFWWMDWRQCEDGVQQAGFRPLAWLNRLHLRDQQRRNPAKRPVVFACRGGMDGAGFQIGFSADACSSWGTLSKEIEVTAAAANVLFGYWSHDLGGHMESEAIAPELYLRWMQFGVCSPVFRVHSAKFDYAERRFWNFPAPWNDLLRGEIRRRLRMVPYIYGECRKACDTAIALCRPLYYEYPEIDEAYRHPGEYFFGEHILAAPVASPADPQTGMTMQSLWLPPGKWYDLATGMLLDGGRIIKVNRLQSDLPMLARPGTILPEAPAGSRAGDSGVLEKPVVVVYPGECGEYELYEDDGVGNGYRQGQCVRTRFRHWREGQCRVVEIGAASGTCDGWRTSRAITLRLHGCLPPTAVECNGQSLDWSYDGEELAVVVELPEAPCSRPRQVRLHFAEADEYAALHGWLGIARRLRLLADIQNRVAGSSQPVADDRLAQRLAHFTRRASLDPKGLLPDLQNVAECLPRLLPSFRELQKIRGARFPFSLERVKALLDDIQCLATLNE